MTLKKNNDFKISTWFTKNSIWLLGVAFAIVNVWLASKLSPLVKDIDILQTKVAAIEQYQDKTDARLVRIEEKIDRVLFLIK